MTFTFVGANFGGFASIGRKWQDGVMDSLMYQVLKVEWQVKHPFYLTRISSHHDFIQSYQIAI